MESLNSQIFSYLCEKFDSGASMHNEPDRKALLEEFISTSDTKISRAQFNNQFRRMLKEKKQNPTDFGLKPFSIENERISPKIRSGAVQIPDSARSEDLEIIKNDLAKNTPTKEQIESGHVPITVSKDMVAVLFNMASKIGGMISKTWKAAGDFPKSDVDLMADATLPWFQQHMAWFFTNGFMGFITIISVIVAHYGRGAEKLKELEKKEESKDAQS